MRIEEPDRQLLYSRIYFFQLKKLPLFFTGGSIIYMLQLYIMVFRFLTKLEIKLVVENRQNLSSRWLSIF